MTTELTPNWLMLLSQQFAFSPCTLSSWRAVMIVCSMKLTKMNSKILSLLGVKNRHDFIPKRKSENNHLNEMVKLEISYFFGGPKLKNFAHHSSRKFLQTLKCRPSNLEGGKKRRNLSFLPLYLTEKKVLKKSGINVISWFKKKAISPPSIQFSH